MIINNINGSDDGSGGPMSYDQTGTGNKNKLSGTVPVGQYTVNFPPIGSAPFTVTLNASNGFTVTGIQSPDAIITFFAYGNVAEANNTTPQKQIQRVIDKTA